MKLKLDENLGLFAATLCRNAGHDAATVSEEQLCQAKDMEIVEVCRKEQRSLLTLDLDFANPLRFRPSAYPGIAVLRLPNRPTRAHLQEAIRTFLHGLEREPLHGKLWIVQIGRIRVYQEEE